MTPERFCKTKFNAKFKSRAGVWRWQMRSDNRKQRVTSEYAYISERAAALGMIHYLGEEAKKAMSSIEELEKLLKV